MKVCNNCGSESPDSARVCANCNAVLPTENYRAEPVVETPAQTQAPSPERSQGPFAQDPAQPVVYPGPQVTVLTTDGQAVAALICGILGLFACPLVLSIVAIILGKQSSKSIRASGGALDGEGMAKTGLILGIIGTAFWGLFLVFFLLVFIGVFAGFMGTF
ncbi:MAG TPA: DUF4190 domain-containing protein [Actinomycetota bacterium]|nr:DUF4190 domain-containing protein [Actinomycetota bacterium]